MDISPSIKQRKYKMWENPDGLWHGKALLPLFSMHIADAWRVVKRLIAEGYTIEICHDTETDCQPWLVWLYRGEEDKLGRFGSTAPHAICLAALAAMEAANV